MPIELPPKCPFFYCNSFTFNTKIEKDYQRRCKYLKQKRAFLRLPNSHLHSHHINIKQNKRYHRDTYTHDQTMMASKPFSSKNASNIPNSKPVMLPMTCKFVICPSPFATHVI